jgi:hypothetical protein
MYSQEARSNQFGFEPASRKLAVPRARAVGGIPRPEVFKNRRGRGDDKLSFRFGSLYQIKNSEARVLVIVDLYQPLTWALEKLRYCGIPCVCDWFNIKNKVYTDRTHVAVLCRGHQTPNKAGMNPAFPLSAAQNRYHYTCVHVSPQ